jgi:hypothetical protein
MPFKKETFISIFLYVTLFQQNPGADLEGAFAPPKIRKAYVMQR